MLGIDRSFEIECVDVDFRETVPIGHLFTRNEQEVTLHLEAGLQFSKRAESHLGGIVDLSGLDPVRSERGFECVDLRRVKATVRSDREPAFTLLHHVVIRQHQKVVVVVEVPLDCMFRRGVTVAPQRVGVRVSAIPPRIIITRVARDGRYQHQTGKKVGGHSASVRARVSSSTSRFAEKP